MKIFLSGSRKIDTLSLQVLSLIKKWVSANVNFLVGDAPGIDRAFQKILYDIEYPRVVVYSSAPNIRNNLGSWETEVIESGLKTKSHAMHSAKDRVMSQLCDEGLMIWDRKSIGTLSNVIDVTKRAKPCTIYDVTSASLIVLRSIEELDELLRINDSLTDQALKRLKRYEKRQAKLKSRGAFAGTLFDDLMD